MMIRGLTVSLLFAVLALPAYGGIAYAQDSTVETAPTAQDNPQTRETDVDEDDYRRSQRRRDTGDIFDDIDINTSGSGGGGILGPEVKAIDRLDQESRRHLNKQRAKAMAEAEPGEPIDAAYEPSENAKIDEYIAKQEENAWEEMVNEANSGIGIIQGPRGGGQDAGTGTSQGDSSGDQAGSGQGGQGQAGQSQSGGDQSGQASQRNTSPLRGGSSSSASSILDQLKGRSSGSGSAPQGEQTSGSGQAPSGEAPSGQSSQGDAPSGESTQSGQAPSGEVNQGDSSAQGQTQAPDQGDAQADAQAQNSSNNDAQSQSDASDQATADAASQNQNQDQAQDDAQSRAEAEAAAEEDAANAAAEAAAHRETMSPLERLKRDPVERDDVGGRTSASDYLNRGK